jgi:16S rRNA G1207 methylase RsmC
LPELIRKLGIKSGQHVALLDAPAQLAAIIRENSPPGVTFVYESGGERCDVILFWPRTLSGLVDQFRQLQSQIVPGGAIWAVIPKKKFARDRGIEFSWGEMQAAALQTDLVDNKEASFSDEEYGTRFVIRKARREKYAL